MTIKELLDHYKMTTADLSRRFGIPYKTIQNWKLGTRKCPAYVVNMMVELLEDAGD